VADQSVQVARDMPEAVGWRWEARKVRQTPPEARKGRPRRGFLGLARASRVVDHRLIVTWKGGPEAYWLVQARGTHQIFPGHVSLEDVMARVLSER
jgi:hypothetical protein